METPVEARRGMDFNEDSNPIPVLKLEIPWPIPRLMAKAKANKPPKRNLIHLVSNIKET
jgi:hypothetical protein